MVNYRSLNLYRFLECLGGVFVLFLGRVALHADRRRDLEINKQAIYPT